MREKDVKVGHSVAVVTNSICKLQVVPIRWVRFQPKDPKRITFRRNPCNGNLLQLMCSILMTFIFVTDYRAAQPLGQELWLHSQVFRWSEILQSGSNFAREPANTEIHGLQHAPNHNQPPHCLRYMPVIFQDCPKFLSKGRMPVDMQAH